MALQDGRPIAVFIACIALFGGIRLLRATDSPAPVPSLRDLWAASGLPVEVGRVVKVPVQRRIRLFGMARGREQAEVVCPSPNILEKVHVSVGQSVRAGQVLVSMRDISLSPLGYPYGPLEAKKAALDQDAARVESLKAQDAITAQDYDHFQAERQATEAQFASAKALVDITAPVSGTVTRIDYRPGEMVPNDRPLLEVARLDVITADLWAEAPDMAFLAEGDAVEVRTSALPGVPFSGRVTERSLGAYPVINQYRVRVDIENPDKRLLPGFPLEIDIAVGSADPVLALPAAALTRWKDQEGAWIVADDQTSRFVPLVRGVTDGTLVAVTGDLAEGAAVVTLGQANLDKDGMPLSVHAPGT